MAEKNNPDEAQTHEPETRTFAQLHDFHTGVNPEREAFVIYDEAGKRRSYTFQDIKQRSLEIAAIFLQIGLDKGQNVALMAPNCIEFVLCYLALNRIGTNTILIGARGKTEDEVMAMLERSMCQALLLHPTGDDSFDQHLTENAKKSLGEDRVIVIGRGPSNQLTDVRFRLDDLLENAPQEINLEEVYKRQQDIRPDDPIVCLFTSGSSGIPKVVQLHHLGMVNQCLLFAKHCLGLASSAKPVKNQYRFFNDRPFTWGGSLLLGFSHVFAMGFTFVCCPPTRSVGASDPEFFIRILQDEKCSGAFLLPYLIHDLITNPNTGNYDLTPLKHVVTGGEVIDKSQLANLRSVLPSCFIVNSYGLTEISPVAVSTITPQDNMDALTGAGMKVSPPMEVKVINSNGQVVDPDKTGEICGKTRYRFREYLGDPKATCARVDSSGWVHTGDVGCLDKHGRLHIYGRTSEVIIKVGVKIFPIEVEKVLSAYPDVKAVVVLGVPDEREGEKICACVVPKTGSQLETSVVEFEEWASHQWKTDETGQSRKPGYTLVMEAFPLMNTGKTDRKSLKALALQKLGM